MPCGLAPWHAENPQDGCTMEKSAPPAGSSPERALASTPCMLLFPNPGVSLPSPHSLLLPDPHAHQCLAHGSFPLLGIGVLPLPHVDFQPTLVQNVTVLEVGEKDSEGEPEGACWAGGALAQKVLLLLLFSLMAQLQLGGAWAGLGGLGAGSPGLLTS